MFNAMMRVALLAALLGTAACVCPRGQSCQPDGGGTPPEPPDPGGIRTGVVAIERNGALVGYMSQDPDPSRAHWNWWLLGDTMTFPIELGPTETLTLRPVEPALGRKTGVELCALFGSQFTAPKYYKEVSQASTAIPCE